MTSEQKLISVFKEDENYNGYTVTVICKIDYELGGDIVSKTVNTVLSKGGVKEIKINDFAWSRIWKETVSGMIVRKLAD